MSVRVRFAPSPTGPLHIGGARSALFNWLFARHYGGVFIIRIEDTDLERSSRRSEENILDSMRWLGLDWDEGVGVGGAYGPYRQTERLDIYQHYAGILLEKGFAYHCYCSEAELAAEREKMMAEGKTPKYTGRCRNLTPADCARLEAEGRKPVVRFHVPAKETIHISDLVRGDVYFEYGDIGDFIIVKSDGIPTYNFAVVVDDHTMAVSHVIRAEEHLSNTPRQVLLFDAFGWKAPEFAHVSLILGKDRSKMSKRHGATAIEQYREKGYLPEAMVNFLALLGWSPGGEEEVLSPDELKQQFSLERVAKSPAVFDLDKLNWLNGHYIRKAPLERLVALAVPFMEKAGYITSSPAPEENERVGMMVDSVRKRLNYMGEITGHTKMFFESKIEIEGSEAKEIMSGEQVPVVLETVMQKVATGERLTPSGAKTVLKETGKSLRLKGKQIFMPVRLALTGSIHGPDLDRIMAILGKDEITKRLSNALKP